MGRARIHLEGCQEQKKTLALLPALPVPKPWETRFDAAAVGEVT